MSQKSHGTLVKGVGAFSFPHSRSLCFYILCSLSGPDQPAECLSSKCLIMIVCLLQLFGESLHVHHVYKEEMAIFTSSVLLRFTPKQTAGVHTVRAYKRENLQHAAHTIYDD